MASQAPKLSRRQSKRRIDSDNDYESDEAGRSPSPPPKKRRKSTTIELESDYEEPSPSPEVTPSKPRGKGTKRKRAVSSEDDDFEFEEEEKKPSRSRAKRGSKAAKEEPRTVTAKFEGVSINASPKEKEEDMDVDVVSSAPTPGEPPADPPKKKYPTIKKKSKPQGDGDTPKQSSKAAGKAPAATNKESTPKKSGAPAATQNPSGTTDFDLRDSNTWLSILGKGKSNAGPKVGIEKSVSSEERRKQLDKMREEAKAKRAEEFKNTFDLQSQSQTIGLFEMRLKNRQYGPQMIGAAFKQWPLLTRDQSG